MVGSVPVMEVRTLLAYTQADTWHPGIGDPTVMGWVTVAAYFCTAILCFCQFRSMQPMPGAGQRKLFWGALTLMLIFLGINKQLDLQTWFTLAGKRVAIAQGWYENRRVVQALFVLLVAVCGVVSSLLAYRIVRSHPELRTALLGFIVLFGFVVIRAASFHHFDSLINFRFAGVRMNWVLELGAIFLLAVGASRGRARHSEEDEPGPARRWVAAR